MARFCFDQLTDDADWKLDSSWLPDELPLLILADVRAIQHLRERPRLRISRSVLGRK